MRPALPDHTTSVSSRFVCRYLSDVTLPVPALI